MVGEEAFSRFVNDALPNETGQENSPEGQAEGGGNWKPLLLIIPLRLGLTDINPIYFEALKVCCKCVCCVCVCVCVCAYMNACVCAHVRLYCMYNLGRV